MTFLTYEDISDIIMYLDIAVQTFRDEGREWEAQSVRQLINKLHKERCAKETMRVGDTELPIAEIESIDCKDCPDGGITFYEIHIRATNSRIYRLCYADKAERDNAAAFLAGRLIQHRSEMKGEGR